MRAALGLGSDVPDSEVQAAYDGLQASWQVIPVKISAIVGLEEVKMHLRLASSDREDAYLTAMIGAALRSIENATGRDIAVTWPDLDAPDRKVVTQASLLLIGHWYANREAVGERATEMPLAVKYLLDPLRRFVV